MKNRSFADVGRGFDRRRLQTKTTKELEKLVNENPGFPDLHNQLGISYTMVGELERAIECFKKACELNQKYVEAHLNLAVVLNETGKYEEARKAFQQAVSLEYDVGEHKSILPEIPASVRRRLTSGHSEIGDMYRDVGVYSEAVAEYTKALKLSPQYLDIRLKLGRTYSEMRLLDEAVNELEMILRENPNYLEARIILGTVLHQKGEKDKAEEEWKRCLEQDPKNVKVKSYLELLKKTNVSQSVREEKR